MCDARGSSTSGAKQAKITTWNRWLYFCSTSNMSDPDLSLSHSTDTCRIACAFVAHARRTRLRKRSSSTVKKDAVRKIIYDVDETFSLRKLNESVNLFVNENSKMRNIVSNMLSSHKIKDPLVKRESLVTPSIIRIMLKLAKSKRHKFIMCFVIIAFFYAIRSCEHTSTHDEPRSTIITSNNVSFSKESITG